MVKNPKFLKNLLTTASALAIVSLSATSASAAGVAKAAAAADAAFATAASWNPAAAVANGDHLTITNGGGANSHIVGDSARTVTINTAAVVGPRLSVGNTTVGIAGVVGTNGLELKATNAGANFVLGLNTVVQTDFFSPAAVGDYSALGSVDFNDTDATVTIATANKNFATNFANVAGTQTNGLIVVDAKGTTFSGAFSNAAAGNRVKQLTINDGKDLTLDTNLFLGEDLIIGSAGAGTAKVTAKGTKNVTVREIKGDAAGKGILAFEGASTVAATVGTTKSLALIQIGNTDVTAGVVGGGIVEFRGNAAANDIKATEIKLGHVNSVLRTATRDANIQGKITTTAGNNTGSLEIARKTTIDGAGTVVGAEDARLKTLKFDGNTELVVGDGVNIFLTNSGAAVDTGITAGVAGDGHLHFAGNSVVDAVFTTRAIGQITSDNVVKTVTFKKNVTVSAAGARNGIITIGTGGTMEFGGDVTAARIVGPNIQEGTAVFNNADTATITLANAGGNRLLAIKVAGKDLKFATAGAIPKSDTIDFGDQAANITMTAAGDYDFTTGSNTTVTTTSTTRNQNFTITDGDLTLYKAGSADKHFGTFSVAGATAANIRTINVTEADFYASIGGGANVNASFTAVDGKVDNIGAANNVMNTVNFAEDAEVFGDAYAKELTIADTKEVAFNKTVGGGKVTLDGATATSTFKDGSKLLSTLETTNPNEGIANFEGSTTSNGVGKNGTPLDQLNFTADNNDKTQFLTGDFYANDISLLKTTAKATGAVVLHGTVDAVGTTFDLTTNGITLADGVAANPSTFSGDLTLKTTFNGDTNGKLTVSGANTEIDFAGANSINVILNDQSSGRRRTSTTIGVLTLENGGTLDNLDNVTVSGKLSDSSNKYVNWVFDEDSLTFTSDDITDDRFNTLLTSKGGTEQAKENAKLLADSTDSMAEALVNEWIDLDNNVGDAVAVEAHNRFSSQTANTSTAAVAQSLQQAGNVVTGRMQTLANPAALRVTQADGVAAGAEDTLRYGAWGSPFYSQGVQKMRKGVSGYKSKTVGGTIGFDTMANDTMIVGIAATIAKTDLKHKDINSGDKTKADTLMFSIYGLQEIANDWFLQGVANFGSTKVKNTSKRIGYTNGARSDQTATAKYDSMSWGGEVMGGYNYNVSSMAVVTPMLGLDYTRTNDGGYTETGTRNQNQIVSKKATDKVQLVAGVRAVMADIEQSGFVITPEVHGFVRQALGNKKAKLDVKLGSTKLAVQDSKPAKTTGNLGLGINASSGMMTYGLTYDAHLANKYVGHQGTFKVRVNF